MNKKVSISMENDQVTAIEVDGVQYGTVEEISDLEDRAQVDDLLLKMTNDDRDDPFDNEFHSAFGPEFEREFEQFHQKRARFPSLIGSIFLGVAVILLVITGLVVVNTAGTLQRELPADGRVVDLVNRQSSYTKNGQTVTEVYSYPMVEFSLPDGQQKRVVLDYGTWPPAYTVGESITVMYDSANPENARIRTSSNVGLWILPGITGTIGLIFLVVALALLRSQKKKTDDQSPKWD